MEFRVPSARNDLCGGEGAGGRWLSVLLTGPVCLSDNKTELSHAVLGFPLLDIGPPDLERMRWYLWSLASQCRPHPLLSLPHWPLTLLQSQLQPVLDGPVLSQPAANLLSGPIKAGWKRRIKILRINKNSERAPAFLWLHVIQRKRGEGGRERLILELWLGSVYLPSFSSLSITSHLLALRNVWSSGS